MKVNGPGVRSAGKGQYIADVSGVTQKTITISVSVIDDEGKTKPMGKRNFASSGYRTPQVHKEARKIPYVRRVSSNPAPFKPI